MNSLTKAVLGLSIMSSCTAKKYNTYEGGPTFEIAYDAEIRRFKFEADVLIRNDLELILGANSGTDARAVDTDVVHFIAGKQGRIEDLWGTASKTTVDTLQDYQNIDITITGDNYHFAAFRKANTYDK